MLMFDRYHRRWYSAARVTCSTVPNYVNEAAIQWDLKRLFVLPLLRGEMGVGTDRSRWQRSRKNRRCCRRRAVTMTCVSRSVTVRERCWISSHPPGRIRSVQRTRMQMEGWDSWLFVLFLHEMCFALLHYLESFSNSYLKLYFFSTKLILGKGTPLIFNQSMKRRMLREITWVTDGFFYLMRCGLLEWCFSFLEALFVISLRQVPQADWLWLARNTGLFYHP